MGIQPSEWRGLLPAEMFEIKEMWIEANGGQSQRQAAAAEAEFARLKRLYPDTPCEGTA